MKKGSAITNSKNPAKETKESCDECPIAKVTGLIGDHWSPLIVRDLLSGPKRFGDFSISLAGISSRTLTKKLQFLEKNMMIEREEYSEKPPRVEYTLTKKGREFNHVIEAMRTYGEKWLD